MRSRGTRGGVVLTLDGADTDEAVETGLQARSELLAGNVIVELAASVPFRVIDKISRTVLEAGGQLVEVRPPGTSVTPTGGTEIVARTVRSGAKVESIGSIVVLGDVNAGAELIANDDIIVLGTLRGLAHAGAGGNEAAVIWAQQILSPQLRIGGALAQAGDGNSKSRGPEVAHLREGAIVIRPWS